MGDDSDYEDEEWSSDSEPPATDSDEDFTPDKERTPTRKSQRATKLQKYQYSEVSDNHSY